MKWKVLSILYLGLLPAIAWAQQDEHDKPQPLPPEAKSAQLWTYGILAAAVCLFLVWYWLRRWQITRSGSTVEGINQNQD